MASMFDDGVLDDPERLARIDDDLRRVAGWGAEVRRADVAASEALAGIAEQGRPRAVVAAGPDGRLFRAVLEPVCPVPFVAWPHPGLPGWAGPLDLAVVMSTTGTGEEEIGVVGEAVRRGCDLLVAAPVPSPLAEAAGSRATTLLPAGTTDPLAQSVPVLCALHRLGLGPEVSATPVADALDEVAVRCAPGSGLEANPAKELALVLADAVPVVWGGSVLAARAARRVAEELRAASGRPAIAGEEAQIVPMLLRAAEVDIFADPYDAEPTARPALVVLDDGAATAPALRASQQRILDAAERRGVRVHTVTATEGPDVGRFASLLATGRFAAAYLSLALGRAEA
ncbi:MAG TPA: SIS domain-containing protein [Jiangellales bacterium]|nr:SIS domain-containing protein [Jiangellales bacterium]